QGMGGAMMTPVARLVLVRATPRNQLVDAMAWLSIPGLIGPIVGPPIGGFITTYASWHWIFLINVPIGLIGIWLVGIYLPEWQRNEPRRMDFLGFVLAGTAFAGWVFGISVVTLPALPVNFGIAALVGGTMAAAAYLWHFRRTPYPLLDLRLFRLPIFRATMIGGTFFRLGTGAMPFLFPLMLQLAFGLNAFQTGTITFASAVGAFAAKFAAERVLQRIGFRTAMIVTTAGTVAGVIGMGLYTPETPVWVMMTLLVCTGLVQSIFWTATNAFVFADVEDKDAGQANVISQVGVQLSLAFGVALGGGALELFRHAHGGEPTLTDFHLSFYVIAAVGIVSTLIFARLPRNAGASLSGHAGDAGGH
ncbi:MAG TPA: MFS transporter, partial [Devosia sp.]|nr:MFS transporter [Devosia sp.]